tara:strand:- start:1116 stop:2261 length:1146 start_codon:yes stop_codon:yes gene_type:complete
MSEPNKIPTEFFKIMKEFTNDILTSFPEYKDTLDKGLMDILNDNNESENAEKLFAYIKNIYPERFFDFLYQNEDMFTNNEINTNFLPDIDFAELWKQDISENTKTIIWKYLQLVLFSVIGNEKDSNSFGDTAKLFEAINEDDLKKKLEEAMEQMSNIFDMDSENSTNNDISNINHEDLPNPEDLHNHINGLLKGNLGKLATEITEETMKDLDIDMENTNNVGDVFQNLFKNPGKLMKMIKKVGDKLDTKLKSGELKESELMEEAMELMQQMESMPGMQNMKEMMSKMGMPMGRNSKMNMNAMSSTLKQNVKQSKQKERMRRKLEERRAAKKDNQIEILKQQLAAAKQTNINVSNNLEEEVKSKKKKKKKRKKNKKLNNKNK